MKTQTLAAIQQFRQYKNGVNANNEYVAGEVLAIQLDRFEPSDAPCEDLTVFIGENICPIDTCDSSSSIVSCTLPGQPTGAYPIRVNFAAVGDAVSDITLPMAYHIESIFPLSGSYGGGTAVTIMGSGFLDDDDMGTLCGNPLEGCVVNNDNTQAVCLTPSMKRITVEEELCEFVFYQLDPGMRAGINFNFQDTATAVVTSVQPARGGTEGGTRVTILGSQFVPGQTTVSIDGSACNIQFETTALIVCETTAHREATGKHPVVVFVTGNGNAIYTDEDNSKFWYIDRWSSIFTWGCNDTS